MRRADSKKSSRNPVAKSLRTLSHRVVKSKKAYKRRGRSFADDLIEGLKQALAHARGDSSGISRITIINVPVIKVED